MAKPEVVQPTKKPGTLHSDFIMTHPSYAQVGVNRVSSTGSTLYGSEMNHRNTMRLTIYTSELHRGLSNDRYHADRRIMEIEMSESQWATLISSPNIGHGVPCTLIAKDGHMYPSLPLPEDKSALFKKEAMETCQDAYKRLEALREVLETATMPAKARKAIEHELDMAIQELRSNLPFVLTQFEEHIEDTVEKGKQELMAFAQMNGITARRVQGPDKGAIEE